MEDFKVVKNNLRCGFITYSEFVAQWENALKEHGLIFSFETREKLNEINREYQMKLGALSYEILEKQGWLAE